MKNTTLKVAQAAHDLLDDLTDQDPIMQNAVVQILQVLVQVNAYKQAQAGQGGKFGI
jgi:hypothetical protein